MNDRLEQTKELDRLKRALIALEKMQARLDQVEYAKTEPIAIIGMGCRFPGGADNPEIFWQLLCDGVDAIREVPSDRWDVDAYYDPDPDAVGKISIKYGGFIDRIDQFDPHFFGMSPREAVTLDPQQRLLLEVSWETLENGGFVPEQLMGTQTGVFIGISNIDYVLLTSADPEKIDAYMSTGSGHSTAAGRLSYLLGLRGPAIAMDTACSSSLAAIHLACQSLRAKECHLALAGGTNALLSPEFMMNFSKARMLSPDGRCKTFDASANGYVRSEGCGMIILKRLSDALKDNDHILALIRGSAINHDGRTSGLTVPNGPSQQAVIRKALENAGLEPNQVGYIEAHGTGTSLGDPIELGALQQVFGKDRAQDNPLIVGSVKTNMGHLESAAGIVGLMKAVLALHQKKIPPHLHFNEPNPKFEWETFPAIRVPTQATSWPLDGRTRIAGVSSFGFSGTNVHVVLEEAPVKASKQKAEDRRQDLVPSNQEAVEERPLHLLTLSAKTGEALNHLAERYEKYVATHPDVAIGDVCFTANTCRTQFQHRLAVLGTSGSQICEKLTAFNDGQEGPGLCQGYVKNGEAPKIAFLFTGQGSQYVGMGRQLYETQPLFRQILDQCDEILRSYLEIPLLKVLYPTSINTQPFDKLRTAQSTIIDQTAYTQPAIFVLEYALAKLWLSWGIQPAVVLGHSVGEYAAACIAGVFSLEDGLKLIAARGQLMQTHCKTGDMLTVRLDEAHVVETIQPYASDVSIAAINGPESIVLSGEHEAIQACKAELESRGIKTRQLSVSHAFHSPLMEPILPHFEQIAREVVYSPPTIKFCSNLHAQFVTDEIVSPEYWCRHVRQPVRFADGMARLFEQDYEVFLEIGPKPILLGMGRQIREGSIQYSVFNKQEAEDNSLQSSVFRKQEVEDGSLQSLVFRKQEVDGKTVNQQSTLRQAQDSAINNHQSEIFWLPSLRPGQGDWLQLFQSVGELYVHGVQIDWAGLDQDYLRHKVVLPTYPFQRERYWIEPARTRSIRHARSKSHQQIHPLLGQRLHSAALKKDEIVFESTLGPDSETFLSHHRVFDTAILPAAGYLEMALTAGRSAFKSDHLLVEDFLIHQALVFPEHDDKTLQMVLRAEGSSAYSFQIFSLVEHEDTPAWICHASGRLIHTETRPAAQSEFLAIQERCREEIPIDDFYQFYLSHGIEHGSSFRAIEELRYNRKGEAIALIQLPDSLSLESSDFYLHPVLLDACFQVLGATFFDEERGDLNETRLPVSLDRMSLYRRPTARLCCIVKAGPEDDSKSQNFKADLLVLSPDGEQILNIEAMKSQRVRRETLESLVQGASQEDDCLYKVVWQPYMRLGLPADYLPNPGEIQEHLRSEVKVLRPRIEAYKSLLVELENLSLTYLFQALKQMGWTFEPSQQFSREYVTSQLGVISQHQKLFESLLEILVEEQLVRLHGDTWEVLTDLPDIVDPQEQTHRLTTKFPELKAELILLDRCGSRLAEVLTGRCDPLQLLFPGGDTTILTQFYQHAPGPQAMNTLVRKTISTALKYLPQGRGIRILEIGAGTGGTTAYLLPHLPPQQTEYVFTDVSPLFLTQAQTRFNDYPFVQYQLLDIEQAPSTQGFDEQEYDIIVAANVLHATRDLQESLDHVHRLLASGGMLVILEGTMRQRWVDLTFGLTEGWWRFTDSDMRSSYPLLPSSQWRILLEKKGFSQIAILSPEQEDSTPTELQVVMVAQKAADKDVFLSSFPDKFTSDVQWLIFADDQGIGEELDGHLRLLNTASILVFPGQTYERLNESSFNINPASPDDFQRLFSELAKTEHYSETYIVHLWSLYGRAEELQSIRNVEAAQIYGCGSVLHLIQTLGTIELLKPPTLYLVTQGAMPVSAHNPNVQQSPLWGMGNVIAAEHPELNCVRIDLDPNLRGDEAQVLLEEICSQLHEDQIAFRDKLSYKARLIPLEDDEDLAIKTDNSLGPTFRMDSTYLITGGLGGLGLLTAQWMVEKQGVKRLVLAGRSAVKAENAHQLQRLKETGAEIVVVQADVSDSTQLSELLFEISQSGSPLRGVIHAAGVLDDGVLASQSWERFKHVMQPKVFGAWNLHKLTEQLPLDFFVLFSSASVMLWSPAQANHVAANMFLDALAHYRRSRGLAGMSINWGVWSEIGSAAQKQTEEQIEIKGMRSISPQQGLQYLEHVFLYAPIQAAVVPVNWPQFLTAPWTVSPFFRHFKQRSALTSSTSKTDFIEQLVLLPLSEQREGLNTYIRSQVARVLGLQTSQQIDPQQGFFDLGMDSLTSMELKNRLQISLKCSLSPTVAFKYSTVEALTNYLFEEVLALDAAEPAKKTQEQENTSGAALKKMKQMSEKELEDIINAEFDALVQGDRPL